MICKEIYKLMLAMSSRRINFGKGQTYSPQSVYSYFTVWWRGYDRCHPPFPRPGNMVDECGAPPEESHRTE